MKKKRDFPTIWSWRYHLLNYTLPFLKGKIDLSEDFLLTTAQKYTGLSDWGGEEFREPLRKLLDSYENEAELNNLGRFFTQRHLLHRLCNRLKIQKTLKENPDIHDVEIPKPIFIIGPGRSGTTFLHRLMGQDPTSRTFQFWEVLEPAPSPNKESYQTDPRREKTDKGIWLHDFLLSKHGVRWGRSIHDVNYDDTEECWPLFQNAFMSQIFTVHDSVPSYITWLRKQDMTPAYEYYRLQIKILLYKYSGTRLVVKQPAHANHIREILTLFPDAQIVSIHRDPTRTVASAITLLFTVRQFKSYQPTQMLDTILKQGNSEIKEEFLENRKFYLNESTKSRESYDPNQFTDLNFYEFIKDPLAAVRQIYQDCGHTLSPEAETRLEKWLAKNNQRRSQYKKMPKFDCEYFGVPREEVNAKFVEYRERFGISTEE